MNLRTMLSVGVSQLMLVTTAIAQSTVAMALPPPEEVPEEILRTEILTEARSPINGERLTAAEYAELQEELQEATQPRELSPQVQQIIFLLQIRRGIRAVAPFLLN